MQYMDPILSPFLVEDNDGFVVKFQGCTIS